MSGTASRDPTYDLPEAIWGWIESCNFPHQLRAPFCALESPLRVIRQ